MTGSTSGIGLAIANAMAAAGSKVCVSLASACARLCEGVDVPMSMAGVSVLVANSTLLVLGR